jgi:hypothetical protein
MVCVCTIEPRMAKPFGLGRGVGAISSLVLHVRRSERLLGFPTTRTWPHPAACHRSLHARSEGRGCWRTHGLVPLELQLHIAYTLQSLLPLTCPCRRKFLQSCKNLHPNNRM